MVALCSRLPYYRRPRQFGDALEKPSSPTTPHRLYPVFAALRELAHHLQATYSTLGSLGVDAALPIVRRRLPIRHTYGSPVHGLKKAIAALPAPGDSPLHPRLLRLLASAGLFLAAAALVGSNRQGSPRTHVGTVGADLC